MYECNWVIGIRQIIEQHDKIRLPSFTDIRSLCTFCEHSNSSWGMFEPAQQASLRKELFDRRRSKMCTSDESEKDGSRILSCVLIFLNCINRCKVFGLSGI